MIWLTIIEYCGVLLLSQKTLLHLAVAAQNVSCVEALISAVADLNSVDSEVCNG